MEAVQHFASCSKQADPGVDDRSHLHQIRYSGIFENDDRETFGAAGAQGGRTPTLLLKRPLTGLTPASSNKNKAGKI